MKNLIGSEDGSVDPVKFFEYCRILARVDPERLEAKFREELARTIEQAPADMRKSLQYLQQDVDIELAKGQGFDFRMNRSFEMMTQKVTQKNGLLDVNGLFLELYEEGMDRNMLFIQFLKELKNLEQLLQAFQKSR